MTYLDPDKAWTPEELIVGYSAMAKDAEREAEEWCEGLIGDASADA